MAYAFRKNASFFHVIQPRMPRQLLFKVFTIKHVLPSNRSFVFSKMIMVASDSCPILRDDVAVVVQSFEPEGISVHIRC